MPNRKPFQAQPKIHQRQPGAASGVPSTYTADSFYVRPNNGPKFSALRTFRIIIAVQDSVRSYQDFAANKAKRQAQLAQLGTLPVSPGHQACTCWSSANPIPGPYGVYGYAGQPRHFLANWPRKRKHDFPPCLFQPYPYRAYPDLCPYREKPVQPGKTGRRLFPYGSGPGRRLFHLLVQQPDPVCAWATPVTEIGSTAQHQVWLNGEIGESSYAAYHDGLLVEKAAKDLSQAENALIVIHLKGEHTKYPDRYPAEFAKFTGSANPRVDQYDNAVLYTDDVLKQIYQLASKNPHFQGLVYFSDHGEEVEQGKSHESTKFTPPMSIFP